jgi:hypothetical protein
MGKPCSAWRWVMQFQAGAEKWQLRLPLSVNALYYVNQSHYRHRNWATKYCRWEMMFIVWTVYASLTATLPNLSDPTVFYCKRTWNTQIRPDYCNISTASKFLPKEDDGTQNKASQIMTEKGNAPLSGKRKMNFVCVWLHRSNMYSKICFDKCDSSCHVLERAAGPVCASRPLRF